MKTYRVELPLVGSLVFYGVRASSEREAIRTAQDVVWRLTVVTPEGDELPDVELGEEFETPVHAVEGNVSHLPLSSAFAEAMDEDE